MTEKNWPLEFHPDFQAIWIKVAPFTMTSPQRGFALWQAVNYVIDNDIPGAFVECGVWNGGSSMLIALTLLARGATRNIFLFDTFDGMTVPAGADKDLHDRSAAEFLDGKYGKPLAEQVAARATIDEVRQVVSSIGYDARLIHYVVGDVRTTLPRTQTLTISLLRLDTDFYDSTLAEMTYLYPRVSLGGAVIIDDYGHWQGARKAVDDYFTNPANKATKPMLWAIDYTGRGFIKSEPPGQIEIERYDYVPPGMADPKLLDLFPFAEPVNPWTIKWPYLRPSVPHVFRCDTRNKKAVRIGNASYEEALCLHTVALQFAGKRGLEIGTHFGWTSAHLRAAGLEMDFCDPEFADPDRIAAIDEIMQAIGSAQPYRLWPLYSPQGIPQIKAASPDPWSFVFIDGNHDGDAPEMDARAVLEHCAENAVIMFHDMTSPHVAAGLAVCREAGWNVRLYNTMQILGLAWRGDVTIPDYVQDPNTPALFYPHLRAYV